VVSRAMVPRPAIEVVLNCSRLVPLMAAAWPRTLLPSLWMRCTISLYEWAMIETSYSKARAQLAKLLDEVAENRETVVIRRRKGEAVAMIAASELSSLAETAYLLRSPRNAERLLAALARARAGEGKPMTVEQLRVELGLAPED
jgi:antitoxin YefM